MIYEVGTRLQHKNDGEVIKVEEAPTAARPWASYFVVSDPPTGNGWTILQGALEENYFVLRDTQYPAADPSVGAMIEREKAREASGTGQKECLAQPRTIYYAGSSKDIEIVRRRMAHLKETLNVCWYGGMDWTRDVEKQIPEPLFCGAAHSDFASAINADLFVIVIDDHFSFGAAAEFGARIGVGKIAHVVTKEENRHPFLFHSLVRRWHTWQAFVEVGLK